MNSIEALHKFQATVSQDRYTKDYCGRELKWIRNREQDWAFDRIRVGVVGVTSSGKSTLINAILGRDILSSAVAPSSGQLVCCSFGQFPEIIVRFEDGSKKKLSGEQYSCEKLMQFSDERFNPHNEKGVRSIELTSPQFDLGKDVLLIDSPGLDAFGLAAHEKLTLESLVPTIDACIYVTTMKTNSDKKTREILNIVARYQCPVIIVQNMLDAVRPSPSGDKTSEQVALDHRRRVQRIIDESDIADKGSVRIIQISAEYAKQWRCCTSPKDKTTVRKTHYAQSNYESFVKEVSNILDVQRPWIERQRLLGIVGQMRNAADSLEKKLNKPGIKTEENFSLQPLKERAVRNRLEFAGQYERILEDYREASRKIRVAIGVETDTPPEKSTAGGFLAKIISQMLSNTSGDLEGNLNATNEAVRKFGTQLADLVASYNEFVFEAAEELHIPSRDLLCSSSLHSFRDIKLEKKTKTDRIRVEKEGFGSGIARFFGGIFDTDWGYEYETTKKVVTDVDATKKKICDRLKDAYDQYSKVMRDWSEQNLVRSLDLIQGEIAEEEESYRKRREAAVAVESFSKLHRTLTQLIQAIEKDIPNPAYDVQVLEGHSVFSSKKIEVSPYSSSVLTLSHRALQLQHREIAKKFIQAVDCIGHTPVVIGWDEGCKDVFLLQTGIADAKIILFPIGQADLPARKKKCVFVLVNTVQFGAALKQINALKLGDHLDQKDFVVWVVQDFQELMVGGHTAEGLTQMGELARQISIPCRSMIYILHENPLYNLVFLNYQMDPSLHQAPERVVYEIQHTYQTYTSEKTETQLGTILRTVHLRNQTKE